MNCNYANSFKRISNTTQQQESHLTKGGGTPGVGSAHLGIGVLVLGNLIVESAPKVALALPRRDYLSAVYINIF